MRGSVHARVMDAVPPFPRWVSLHELRAQLRWGRDPESRRHPLLRVVMELVNGEDLEARGGLGSGSAPIRTFEVRRVGPARETGR